MQLTQAQCAQFARDGYLAIPNMVSKQRCAQLRERANALVHDFAPGARRTVFSSRSQGHAADQYFFDSAQRVHFFFEEEAVDREGRLLHPKERAINKIGHGLHMQDPVFEGFSNGADLANLVVQLGIEQPRLIQSMYIFKQPGIGGEVLCHQDATFLYTEPQSLIGLWFALEDATVDNGCLWAMRGGHRLGLKKRFVRDAQGTSFETLDAKPWPENFALSPLEVAEGSLILLHGLLPHKSDVNRSPRSRHAYTLHAVDARSHYPANNWLQPAAVEVELQ